MSNDLTLTLSKNNFNGGEISPALYYRYQYPYYNTSCRQFLNTYSGLPGNAIKRPGTRFLCEAICKETRLFEFEYSPSQSYDIEIGVKANGDGVFRFYAKSGQVVNADGTPYELASPYRVEDFDKLYVKVQSYDVLYIYHNKYKSRMLIRKAHLDWELKDIVYGSSVPTVQGLTANEAGDASYSVTGVDVLQREGLASTPVKGKDEAVLNWTALDVADYYNIYMDDANSGTFYFIGQATNTSYTVPANIESDKGKTPPVNRKPFSQVGDYPACAILKDQRMVVASTINKSNMVAGSVTGDFYNMNISRPLQDNDAWTHLIDAQQSLEVRWMWSTKIIVIGCSTGLWILQPGAEGNSVTASSYSLISTSKENVSYIVPCQVGNSIIFVDASQKKIRDLLYSFEDSDYNSSLLTVNSEHLFEHDKILGMTYQQFSQDTVYMWQESGQMCSLNYNAKHQVKGFGRHTTKGRWKGLSTTQGDGGTNTTYAVVGRTINGVEKTYIEVFMPGNLNNKANDCWFVDSGLTQVFDEPVQTISNLGHLEGEKVCGIAGEDVVKDLTVVDGEVTLPFPVTGRVTLGLPFDHLIETLDFTCPLRNVDNILTLERQVQKIIVSYTESGDFEISGDGENWIYCRTNWDSEFKTGTIEEEIDCTDGNCSRVWIRSVNPTPLIINSVSARIKIGVLNL